MFNGVVGEMEGVFYRNLINCIIFFLLFTVYYAIMRLKGKDDFLVIYCIYFGLFL